MVIITRCITTCVQKEEDKKKWIRPIEIVLDGFGKENPLARKKLTVELDITEWLYMQGLGK